MAMKIEAVIYVERNVDGMDVEYELTVRGEVTLGKRSSDPQDDCPPDVEIDTITREDADHPSQRDWIDGVTAKEFEKAEKALYEAAVEDADDRAICAAESAWEARHDR